LPVKKNALLPQGIIFLVLVFSCGRNMPEPAGVGVRGSVSSETAEVPVYHTWHSLQEREYGAPVHPPLKALPEVPSGAPDGEIPPGFFPWAGIVSHHLLTHEYLDAWFSRLADMRTPRCFYILSPSHYGLSLEPYSLTLGSWESGFGRVESDRTKVYKLTQALGVDLDPRVFQVEHGVSTLMPYIKKYFPCAKVVALAHEGGELPVNTSVTRRLADALESEFTIEGKQENFLLISSDFSHHANLEITSKRDAHSKQYLTNPGDTLWNLADCDNRPGLYILDRLGKNNLESFILYHTNSFEIVNQWEDDITSYFFVYFGDK
jgi:AmmeMemoRadiSam system protein B